MTDSNKKGDFSSPNSDESRTSSEDGKDDCFELDILSQPDSRLDNSIEKVLDAINITANKNSIAGDTSAVNPGGIRIGTPALTTRGMKEKDMHKVAMLMLKAVGIAHRI